jgi:hypothetical protein
MEYISYSFPHMHEKKMSALRYIQILPRGEYYLTSNEVAVNNSEI